MTKKNLLDQKKLAETEGSSVTITLETSEDAKRVTLEFDSTESMDKVDFLLAIVDWVQDFADEMYQEAWEKVN